MFLADFIYGDTVGSRIFNSMQGSKIIGKKFIITWIIFFSSIHCSNRKIGIHCGFGKNDSKYTNFR